MGVEEVQDEHPWHRQGPIEGYPNQVRQFDQYWDVAEADPQDLSSTNIQAYTLQQFISSKTA